MASGPGSSSASVRASARPVRWLVLVVGNERAGVDPGILAQCDGVLSLPMTLGSGIFGLHERIVVSALVLWLFLTATVAWVRAGWPIGSPRSKHILSTIAFAVLALFGGLTATNLAPVTAQTDYYQATVSHHKPWRAQISAMASSGSIAPVLMDPTWATTQNGISPWALSCAIMAPNAAGSMVKSSLLATRRTASRPRFSISATRVMDTCPS